MAKFIVLFTALFAMNAHSDVPAVHGMLLFGSKGTYASHLPMFHPPHDYQVLLKLKLEDLPRSQTLAHYATAREQFDGIFTLVPEPMDLTAIISGAKSGFIARIYKGHFEQGGQNLGSVQVQVEKVIYSSALKATAPAPNNNYLVFGGSGEYFAAHLIEGKPSFDAILSVSRPYVTDMPVCGKRICPEPVVVPILDEKLPVVIPLMTETKLPAVGVSLGDLTGPGADTQRVIYAEDSDLAD